MVLAEIKYKHGDDGDHAEDDAEIDTAAGSDVGAVSQSERQKQCAENDRQQIRVSAHQREQPLGGAL